MFLLPVFLVCFLFHRYIFVWILLTLFLRWELAIQIKLLICYCQLIFSPFHFPLNLIHIYLSLLSGLLIILNPQLHLPPLIQLCNGHKRLRCIHVSEDCLSGDTLLVINLLPGTMDDLSGYFLHMVYLLLILLNQMCLVTESINVLLGLNNV